MIGDFLKLIDKAIELVNIRQKNDREFFQLILKPLFSEFEVAAKGYFELFRSCGDSKEELMSIRDGYIQIRMKVTSLTEKYRALSKSDDVGEFFELIEAFFFSSIKSRDPEYVPCRSDGMEYIDLVTGKVGFEEFRKIENLQNQLEIKWQSVVKQYAELQIKYELPAGYKA